MPGNGAKASYNKTARRVGSAPGRSSGLGELSVRFAPLDAGHRWVARSLSALPMTSTELMLIAALAIIGLSKRPKAG